MRWRIIGFLVLLILAVSCTQSASSRFEVVQLQNDQLSDLEKIRLFEESANILSGPAYAAIAKLYASSGDYESALETVQLAIVQEPMNSFYHTLKSNYAFELDEISIAYREALTAYQLGSKSLQQSLILAKMGVALSEYSIVNNIIDSLILVYPNDPEVVFMAARKFEKSEQIEEAIEQYHKGIFLEPERADNYYYLAQMYVKQGNSRNAVKTLEQFVLPKVDTRIALLKAVAFENLEEHDSATAYYKFLVAERKDSVIYQRLIDIYRAQDLNRENLEVTRTAADSFPESKRFIRYAGELLHAGYQYPEALVYYKQLFALDTLDTLVAEEIAILQRKIAYLQRKRERERIENAIPIQGITLPTLDSLRKD